MIYASKLHPSFVAVYAFSNFLPKDQGLSSLGLRNLHNGLENSTNTICGCYCPHGWQGWHYFWCWWNWINSSDIGLGIWISGKLVRKTKWGHVQTCERQFDAWWWWNYSIKKTTIFESSPTCPHSSTHSI